MQIAVILFYINGAFGVLYGAVFSGIGLLFVAGSVAAGFGIANERRWGYVLGLAMAFLPFVIRLAFGSGLVGGNLINFLFEVTLVALLLHPQSRDYQRIWFS